MLNIFFLMLFKKKQKNIFFLSYIHLFDINLETELEGLILFEANAI